MRPLARDRARGHDQRATGAIVITQSTTSSFSDQRVYSELGRCRTPTRHNGVRSVATRCERQPFFRTDIWNVVAPASPAVRHTQHSSQNRKTHRATYRRRAHAGTGLLSLGNVWSRHHLRRDDGLTFATGQHDDDKSQYTEPQLHPATLMEMARSICRTSRPC